MANEKNLIPFSSENPPPGKGRPKGSLNRSTIAKRMLALIRVMPEKDLEKLKEFYPEISSQMTVEEIMTLAMIEKTITKGDTSAYQAVMDSAYGKPEQHIEQDISTNEVVIHIIENQADANPGEQNISA